MKHHARDESGAGAMGDPVSMVAFDVEGIPSPGGSKSAFMNQRTRRIVVTCAGGRKTKVWRQAVAAAGRIAMGSGAMLAAPIALYIDFRMPRPRSHYLSDGTTIRPGAPALPIVRPDATKLLRSTEDALTGIVWRDDAEIAEIHISRGYVWEGSSGARITARTMRIRLAHSPARADRMPPIGEREDA